MRPEYDPCLFPSLSDGVLCERKVSTPGDEELTSIYLGPLCSAQTLRNFCSSNGVSLPSLFGTVWALVLGRYLDLEEVGFITLVESKDGAQRGVCHGKLDRSRRCVEIMRQIHQETHKSFGVTRAEDVANLLDSKRAAYRFNTVVRVQQLGGETHRAEFHQVRQDTRWRQKRR